MDKDDQTLRQLIQTVLALHACASHAEVIAQVMHAWKNMANCLCPMIGESGFMALHARTLHLVIPQHAWLAATQPSQPIDVIFKQLQENLLSADTTQAIEASTVLLNTFIRLLEGLIGGELTTRLLNTAWADAPEKGKK